MCPKAESSVINHTSEHLFFAPDLFADKFISPTNSHMTLRSRARVDEFTIYIAYVTRKSLKNYLLPQQVARKYILINRRFRNALRLSVCSRYINIRKIYVYIRKFYATIYRVQLSIDLHVYWAVGSMMHRIYRDIGWLYASHDVVIDVHWQWGVQRNVNRDGCTFMEIVHILFCKYPSYSTPI